MSDSRLTTYFSVEVCDDHDGGSVWIVEEDYMEHDDAEELAAKLSRIRDNQVARVRKVVSEVVSDFEWGDRVVAAGAEAMKELPPAVG